MNVFQGQYGLSQPGNSWRAYVVDVAKSKTALTRHAFFYAQRTSARSGPREVVFCFAWPWGLAGNSVPWQFWLVRICSNLSILTLVIRGIRVRDASREISTFAIVHQDAKPCSNCSNQRLKPMKAVPNMHRSSQKYRIFVVSDKNALGCIWHGCLLKTLHTYVCAWINRYEYFTACMCAVVHCEADF